MQTNQIVTTNTFAVTPSTGFFGTSLRGCIEIAYDQLVDIFGQPNSTGDEYKVDAEWRLKINDVVITIYNWKNGSNYCGDEGLPTDKIVDWHIGGWDDQAYNMVVSYLEFALQIDAAHINVHGEDVCSFLHATKQVII